MSDLGAIDRVSLLGRRRQAALSALASMPALEVAALVAHDEDVPAHLATAWHAPGGTAALAAKIPASVTWSSVPIKILFEECNALLGQQLDTAFEDLTPNTFDGSGAHAWPPWEAEDDGFSWRQLIPLIMMAVWFSLHIS